MDPTQKDPTSPPPDIDWESYGLLEFELTDFDEARRVLDNESVSQFDVATHLKPEQLKKLRRPPVPTDRALNGKGIDWLLSLSPDLRPEHLAEQFPRVANLLAEVWHDPDVRRATIEKLVNSDRKGRKGFPPEVHDELMGLRQWMINLQGWDEPF